MSAVFGIDEQDVTISRDHRAVYMNRIAADGTDMLHALHHVSPEDIVFLKHYTHQDGLDVSAIGVVESHCPQRWSELACFPVHWVWEGKFHIRNPDEENCLRSKALYEEYDIEVQRELLDLMPEGFKLAPEW